MVVVILRMLTAGPDSEDLLYSTWTTCWGSGIFRRSHLKQYSGGSKGSVNLGDIWPMGVRRSRYDQ